MAAVRLVREGDPEGDCPDPLQRPAMGRMCQPDEVPYIAVSIVV